MTWRKEDPESNEARKIRLEIVPYTRGYGLDLGCGVWKAYPHFIGVDVVCVYCKETRFHKIGCPGACHINIFHLADDLPLFASQSLDFVFSSHLLEHIPNPGKALADWWRILKHGGHLVLYLPHADLYPNTIQDGGNIDHKHNFRPRDIVRFMEGVRPSWDLLVSEERDGGDEYSFFQVYRKLSGSENRHSWHKPKPQKTCCVVRYGAFGDMIQTASVTAALKKAGWHIIVNTSPTGEQIIRTDPSVNEIIVQDTNQVPNHELFDYWACIAKKYDKFVNLSETVEGLLLALPGRSAHGIPTEARHQLMNLNYLEFMHMVAGAEFDPKPRFYPTLPEIEWAKKQRKSIPGKVLLWVLSGSSAHKSWPYQDFLIARILVEYPDWHIVMVGDEFCKILEAGWENEPRILRKSGEWQIRNTLAFAEQADMVIGPETGVMNSVSHLDVPKIIFLSHSSEENLTRDWVNCIPLVPEGCDCYPCHKLHNAGFDHCVRDKESGAADCQAKIGLEVAANAFEAHLMILQKKEAA